MKKDFTQHLLRSPMRLSALQLAFWGWLLLFLTIPPSFGSIDLPINYIAPLHSDVDKNYDLIDEYGRFDEINEKETDRCWQAAFANALFTLGLTEDPSQLYKDNCKIWPNELKKTEETVNLYNEYFTNKGLKYKARFYKGAEIKSPTFAREQLFSGQAVLLGVSLDKHIITFQGWDGTVSKISDSDADIGLDPEVANDFTDWSDGGIDMWRLSWPPKEEPEWDDLVMVVSSIITICPVPEPATVVLLSLGCMLLRRKK